MASIEEINFVLRESVGTECYRRIRRKLVRTLDSVESCGEFNPEFVVSEQLTAGRATPALSDIRHVRGFD